MLAKSKGADLYKLVKDVNRTRPSHSIRVPWLNVKLKGCQENRNYPEKMSVKTSCFVGHSKVLHKGVLWPYLPEKLAAIFCGSVSAE
jgi:hypothetical protein